MTAALAQSLLNLPDELIGPVVPFTLQTPQVCRLDFTAHNPDLRNASLKDTAAFEDLVQGMLKKEGASAGIGGYLEDRVIYRRSEHFGLTDDARHIHLGVDIWAPAGTPVQAPLAGRVHSFRDNAHFGDYGPTIILEHLVDGMQFYTLYGHLSRASLVGLETGQFFKKGAAFCELGPFPENGDWPPHLHFQIIRDLQGRTGDFPGVCSAAEKAVFAQLCPDPNLILRSPLLS